VIVVLVAKELDTVWNGESLRETLSVRSGSFRAVIRIGEQDRDRLHSAGARSGNFKNKFEGQCRKIWSS